MSEKDNNRLQGGRYDKIFSENMQENLPELIEHVLSPHITILEDLADDIPFGKGRETDLLKKVIDINGNIFILQVGFRRKNGNKNMMSKTARYSVMLQRKHRLPVLQYVIYIGKGGAKMLTYIDSKNFQFRYHLTARSVVNHRLFLKPDKIEEKTLCLLGNLDKEDPKLILKLILLHIQNGTFSDRSEARYMRQLHVLAQLRNLGQNLIEAMRTIEKFFIIEKDPFYIAGQQKKTLEIAIELQKEGLSTSVIARATKLSIEDIEQLGEQC